MVPEFARWCIWDSVLRVGIGCHIFFKQRNLFIYGFRGKVHKRNSTKINPFLRKLKIKKGKPLPDPFQRVCSSEYPSLGLACVFSFFEVAVADFTPTNKGCYLCPSKESSFLSFSIPHFSCYIFLLFCFSYNWHLVCNLFHSATRHWHAQLLFLIKAHCLG
jgi:hypothetical protein